MSKAVIVFVDWEPMIEQAHKTNRLALSGYLKNWKYSRVTFEVSHKTIFLEKSAHDILSSMKYEMNF